MSLPHTLFLTMLLTLAAWGCERPDPSNSASRQPSVEVDAGTSVAPKRIVSLAPSVTETLFALGAGPRVVAVTRFCDFPRQVKDLPKVGGLTDVDVELVLSLEPDLVVGVDNKTASPLARTLDNAGVRTLFVPVETLDQVAASIISVGEAVGEQASAEEAASRLAIPSSDATDRPAAIVLLGKDPWIGAGPGTFAHEILEATGARNVLADSESAYPTLDVERMTSLQADLVFDTSFGKPDEAIPVGGEPRVVRLDPALMRPGPRLAQAVEQFRAAVEETRGR